MLVGILFGGVGGAFVNNHCVPGLTKIVETKISDESEAVDQLRITVSTINTAAFGLGSILGPILASVLTSFISFRWSFTVIACFAFVVACLQTLFGVSSQKLSKEERNDAMQVLIDSEPKLDA